MNCNDAIEELQKLRIEYCKNILIDVIELIEDNKEYVFLFKDELNRLLLALGENSIKSKFT